MPEPGESRVVLITGASSGIGRATALALADAGARLVLASRGVPALEDVARQCRERGAQVLVVPTDVTDDAAVAELVGRVLAEHGRLDACVHCAAVVAYGRVEDVPADVFDRVQLTNVGGTANVARHVVPVLREQQQGTLVLLGSLLGHIVTPYLSTYVVSKWSVHALARALVIENRDLPDVHVCLVEPGGVDTPVYRQAATYTGHHGKPPPPVVGPERVAARVLDLLARPRRRAAVGVANPVMVLGFTALPRAYDGLVGPLMRLFGQTRGRVAPTRGNVFEPVPQGESTHA